MNATTPTIDLTADIIDVRDIIARVEELETEREALEAAQCDADEALNAEPDEDAQEPLADTLNTATAALEDWDASEDGIEYAALVTLLDELKGNGGDEQWRGDWYPLTLIADRHFRDYAQELAEDCGDVDFSKLSWPLTCIDWDQAARELRMDYSSVTVDGADYWYR